MVQTKTRYRGMVIKPVQTPEGVKYRTPNVEGGRKLYASIRAAKQAIGRKRNGR